MGGGVNEECFLSRSGVSLNVGEWLGESDIVVVVVVVVIVVASPWPVNEELESSWPLATGDVTEFASLQKKKGGGNILAESYYS